MFFPISMALKSPALVAACKRSPFCKNLYVITGLGSLASAYCAQKFQRFLTLPHATTPKDQDQMVQKTGSYVDAFLYTASQLRPLQAPLQTKGDIPCIQLSWTYLRDLCQWRPAAEIWHLDPRKYTWREPIAAYEGWKVQSACALRLPTSIGQRCVEQCPGVSKAAEW